MDRHAHAEWTGDLETGAGTMDLESGTFTGAYTFGSRFGDEKGTNPEELIGAAHAGCFSMALSMLLGEAGYDPESVSTDATVSLDMEPDVPRIASIELVCRAAVPGIDPDEFAAIAEDAKENCPVSVALDVPVTLDAELV